jgi:hypothetical protein
MRAAGAVRLLAEELTMMKRHCIAGMAAGIVLLLGIPADAIVLRYAPKEGSVTKYQASLAGRMQASVPGLGDTMQMEMTGALRYDEKALEKTEKGMKIETALVSGEMVLDVNGQSQSVPMPTGRVVTEMDDRGRVLELVEADVGGQDPLSQLAGQGGENFPNWSQFGAFPEGDVSVGGSWTDTVKIPTPGGGQMLELTFTSRLEGIETRQERKCAKIRTAFEGPMHLSLAELDVSEEDAEGSLDAAFSGEMLWYYDYENSVYAYGEGAIELSMQMSMPMPEGMGGEMTTKMRMNIKTAVLE